MQILLKWGVFFALIAAAVAMSIAFSIAGMQHTEHKMMQAREAAVDLMLEKIKEFERETDAAERLKNIGFMSGFLFCIETLREEERKRHV